MKRFKILSTSTSEDVLGGAVSEANVYIAAYPAPLKDHPHPKDLEVGQSSLCRYSLSGQTGVYRVVRIDDAVDPELAAALVALADGQ